MRVLIFGGTGFVGSHLARACVAAGDEVSLTGRDPSRARELAPGARALACDVSDAEQVRRVVSGILPERVFHLAGFASVAGSLKNEEEVLKTNVLGTLHVLHAVRETAPPGVRVLYVGSAEEYGDVPRESQPIGEDSPLRPLTPYGVSRASASLLALRYALSEGLHVVRTRSFNHTGSGQSATFALPSWTEQLVRAKRHGDPHATVKTGDLTAERDFSGVTTVVSAYRLLLERASSGSVVNVCSGRSLELGALLTRLGEIVGIEPRPELDPARARKTDIARLCGDPSRLEAITGLSLATSLDQDLVALVRETEQRLETV